MKNQTIIAALTTIAALNPEGYTIDAKTMEPVTRGFAVAVADTQNSFGPEGLAKVVEYVSANPGVNAFGGWYDSESGQYFFDATIIVGDLQEAIDLGRANKQLAIFDLARLEEIRL